MGQYSSSSLFLGKLWSETLATSSIYVASNFIPSVFTFDINPDTLALENISLDSLGTAFPITSGIGDAHRSYYLGENPTSGIRFWVDTHKALGIYYYHSPHFINDNDGLGWFSYYSYGWIDEGDAKDNVVYIGAYYNTDIDAEYLIIGRYDPSRDNTFVIEYWRNKVNTAGYANWTQAKVDSIKGWILYLFYGKYPPASGDIAEELLTYSNDSFPANPSLFQVRPGQTINFEFELVIDESTSIRPFTDVKFVTETYQYGDKTYINIPESFATINGTSITISPDASVPSTLNVYALANGYKTANGEYIRSRILIIAVISDAYADGGSSSGGIGGGGSFSGPGGSWGNGIGPSPSHSVVGDLPIGSAEQDSSRTGLFTRYGMSASGLYVVGSALYVESILANVGKEIMSFLWNSPAEALISLISYPFSVTNLVGSTSTNIKFGSLELDISGNALNGSFAQIDWGTISLKEFWGNFLDYAPHTKIDMYLPWCTGSVPIDPHECMPGSLTVKTNIELSKGTCIHNIFGNKGALIGTYSGTCGSQLPMTALDTSGKALALVTAAAGAIVAGAAAGGAQSHGIQAANAPTPIGLTHAQRISHQQNAMASAEAPYRRIQRGASGVALASSIATFRTPNQIVRNGSFSGSGAGMSIQYPFIIISRPEQSIPDGYGHYFGYPSNVFTGLGAVSGYAEIGSIHLDGFSSATVEELEEIESRLKEGVIF